MIRSEGAYPSRDALQWAFASPWAKALILRASRLTAHTFSFFGYLLPVSFSQQFAEVNLTVPAPAWQMLANRVTVSP